MNIDYSRSAYVKKDDEEENCWQRRSGLERKLIILSVIAVLFAIGCLLYLILGHSQPPEICNTPTCLSAASQLASYMDAHAEPCEDFYQFVCGKSSKAEDEPIRLIVQQELQNNMLKQLDELIEEPISDDDYYLVRNQKKLLQACMNNTGSEQSMDIFHDTFLDEIGGWPVAKNFHWRARLFDWKDTMYLLRRNGYPYSMLLRVGVRTFIDDPSSNIVYITDPFVNVIPEEHLQAYKNYMIDVAIAFGAERHRAEIEMPEMLEFMKNLEKIKEKNHNHTTYVSFDMTETRVKDYQDRHGEIDWLEFINNILDPIATISSEDYVIFPTDEYTEAFFGLMDNTLKRIQAHYMIWMVLEKVIPYMNDELKRLKENYICQTKQSSLIEDRKEFCKSVIDMSPFRVAYANKYLTTESEQHVRELFQYIKSEFTTSLTEVSWIDQDSATNATQKAEAIVDVIGVPQGSTNDTEVDDIGNVDDSEEDNYSNTFFGMALKRYKQENDYTHGLLYMPDNYTIFNDWLPDTDVTYLHKTNVVVLPAGFIQKSYYDQDRPMYLNYAAMGTAIGSQLGWGFLYSEDDIWSADTEKELEIQKECISKDMEEWNLKPGNPSNDAPSVEQSIVDHVGVKLAYKAYESWAKDNNEEAQLIGMEYTPYQLFWISAMSFNCVKITEHDNIKNNGSIVWSLLTNGPFRNNPDFANDFNCAADTAMNPSEKCEIF